MSALLRVEIPMSLPSAGNLHEHWRNRQRRIWAQRNAVRLAVRYPAPSRLPDVVAAYMWGASLVVTLTRVSPRKLDSDNLAFAFKGVRDQVAAELGIDDGSDAVTWEYMQEKGKAAVRIEIARRVPVLCCCNDEQCDGRCVARRAGV